MTPRDDVWVIGDIARRNARTHPDAEAVVDGVRRVTWLELLDRTDRLADALVNDLGLTAGDRVGFVGDNCLEAVELAHATARAGLVFVPLNSRLAEIELLAVVDSVEPGALFHTATVTDLADALTGGRRPAIAVGGPDGSEAYERLLGGARAIAPTAAVDPDDVSSICFTSGTTGRPKGVLMRHGAQLAFARSQRVVEPIRELARHLYVRPMAVAPGHRLAAWHGLFAGTTVLHPRFDPARFFSDVAAERITNTLLAPTMLRMLLDHPDSRRADLSSLVSVVYGGAPMPRELLAEVRTSFPCNLMEGYGSSEAGQVLCARSVPERHRPTIGSNGWAMPGVDVELRSPDTGDRSDTGELHVRSPQLMAGYWRDPAASAAVLRDGWYVTGDLAERHADGSYSVVGRVKEMIISGGFNVMPSEVEAVLSAHDAVRDVAVFGVPDRLWGEAVAAAVVLTPGSAATAEDLTAWCVEHLAAFKKPRTVTMLADLPRTAAGKTDKAALRRLVSPTGAST